MEEMIFRRRRLPHQDVKGHPVFITGCLEGSLSASGFRQITEFRESLAQRPRPVAQTEAEWQHHKQKLLFAFVDHLLDHDPPVDHLKDDVQAEIVQNAFLHFANDRYRLLAFVVMPSHHHWLFLPNDDWATAAVKRAESKGEKYRTPREIISHSIQSYTATMCNRVREKTGVYWQHETFDHWARDESEAIRISRYIENNPVVAGLCKNPEDYRWSSAKIRKEQNPRGVSFQLANEQP